MVSTTTHVEHILQLVSAGIYDRRGTLLTATPPSPRRALASRAPHDTTCRLLFRDLPTSIPCALPWFVPLLCSVSAGRSVTSFARSVERCATSSVAEIRVRRAADATLSVSTLTLRGTPCLGATGTVRATACYRGIPSRTTRTRRQR